MQKVLVPVAVALMILGCGPPTTQQAGPEAPAARAQPPKQPATPSTVASAAAPAPPPAPEPVVTALAAGSHFSCAIRAKDGRVVCWGMLPLEEEIYHPPRVMGPNERITNVAAGTEHVCAVTAAQKVYCWGQGSSGQLGVPSLDRKPSKTPVHVARIKRAKRLTARSNNNCALLADDALACWGYYVELPKAGGLRTYMVLEPDFFFHLPSPAQEAGDGGEGCVRLQDGRVACWSRRKEGTTRDALLIKGIDDAVDLDVMGNACIVRRDGRVSCWGDDNVFGQLGTTAVKESKESLDVPGITDAVDVCVGSSSACALHQTGAVSCWGSSTSGQLGRIVDEAQPPTRVPGVADATAIVCGHRHACVTRKDGAVVCWGSSMGPGKPGAPSAPRVIPGIADAT